MFTKQMTNGKVTIYYVYIGILRMCIFNVGFV